MFPAPPSVPRSTAPEERAAGARARRETRAVGIACFGLWMVLARDGHPLSIAGAALGSALAAMFTAPVFFERDPVEGAPRWYRLDWLALALIDLMARSYIAAFSLIRGMITRRYRPGVVRIPLHLRSQLGRAVMANAISLVPGTLSLWISGRNLHVHCFDLPTDHSVKAAHAIKGRMERTLERVFG